MQTLKREARDRGFKKMPERDRRYTSFDEGALQYDLPGDARLVLGTAEGQNVLWMEASDGVSLEWDLVTGESIIKRLDVIEGIVEGVLIGAREDSVFDLEPETANTLADCVDAAFTAHNVVKFPV